MNRQEFISKCWKYYLMLEKRFIETMDFVEIAPQNYGSFSNHYAMIIQATGAELDSFFKIFCGIPAIDHSTIADYANRVPQDWPKIRDQKIEVKGTTIVLQPFKDWDAARAKQSLPWWVAFDNIKHSRDQNMTDANQENALNILAALYMLEMKELNLICDGKEPDIPENESKLFELEGWNYRFLPAGEGFAYVDGKVCMVATKRVTWGS